VDQTADESKIEALALLHRKNPEQLSNNIFTWRKNRMNELGNGSSEDLKKFVINRVCLRCFVTIFSAKLELQNVDSFFGFITDCLNDTKMIASISELIQYFPCSKVTSFIKGVYSTCEKPELLIKSLRSIKLQVYPEDRFNETLHFLEELDQRFQESHGQELKESFCTTLCSLLDPLVQIVSAEINVPKWQRIFSRLFLRAMEMVERQRHFAIPLACVLLCLYSEDLFKERWNVLVELLFSRVKVPRVSILI